jgi:DDE domain
MRIRRGEYTQVASVVNWKKWRKAYRSPKILEDILRRNIFLHSIATLVLDFDGVFTDNKVIVFQDGREAVICDRSDGWGLAQLKKIGLSIVVLSTEANPVIQERCNELGIACLQNVRDKRSALMAWLQAQRIERSQVVMARFVKPLSLSNDIVKSYANQLRRWRPRPGDTWHMDEALLTIHGARSYLWRAVEQDDNVLDILVQSRRNKKAAKQCFKKLLKGLRYVPRVLIINKLKSYAAAKREVMPGRSIGRVAISTTGGSPPTGPPVNVSDACSGSHRRGMPNAFCLPMEPLSSTFDPVATS